MPAVFFQTSPKQYSCSIITPYFSVLLSIKSTSISVWLYLVKSYCIIKQLIRQTSLQPMKTFSLKITLDSLKLRIKFNCQVSLTLKYKNRDYAIIQDRSLHDGQITAPTVCIRDLQSQSKDYAFSEKQQVDKKCIQITLVLHVQSSHGNLKIGSFSYKLRTIQGLKRVKQKIRNSPDRLAEINMTFQIQTKNQLQKNGLSKIESQRKNKSLFHVGFAKESQIQNQNNSKVMNGARELERHQKPWMSYKYIQSPNNLKRSEANFQIPTQSIITENQVKPKLSRYDLKSIYSSRKKESTLINAKSLDRVDNLKKKLSQLQTKSSQLNNNNIPNQNYVQKMASMQKQINLTNDTVNNLKLQMKLKQNSMNFLQKQLENKKNKIQALQSQIKESNKNVQIGQQKIRQFQYNVKKIKEQLQQCIQQKLNLINRYEKREEQSKNQIKQALDKYHQVEKEKDKLVIKFQSLQMKLEDKERYYQQHIKEREKKFNDEKNNLTKKINSCQQHCSQFKNQNKNLKANLQTLTKQLSEQRRNNQKLQQLNTELKDKQEKLVLQLKSLSLTRNALSDQLEEQKKVTSELNKIKKEMQEKQEEISLLKKYKSKIQQELSQVEQKARQAETDLQNLERQYQKLYFEKAAQTEELESKKKMIDELIQSRYDLQKKIETLKLIINSQEIENNQNSNEMKEKLKEFYMNEQKLQQNLKEALDAVKEKSLANKQLQLINLDFKKKNDQLTTIIQSLQNEKENLSNKIRQYKANSEKSQLKIEQLSKKIDQLTSEKKETESSLKSLIQKLEQQLILAEEQKQTLKVENQRLQTENNQLTNLVEESNNLLQSKQNTVSELSEKLRAKHNEVRQANSSNEMLENSKQQLKNSLAQLNIRFKDVSQQLNKFKIHLNEIDRLIRLQRSIFLQKNLQIQFIQRTTKISSLLQDIQRQEKELLDDKYQIERLKGQNQRVQQQRRKLIENVQNSGQHIQQMNELLKKNQSHFSETISTLQYLFDKSPEDVSIENPSSNSSIKNDSTINNLGQSIKILRIEILHLKKNLIQAQNKIIELKQQLKESTQSENQLMQKKMMAEEQLSKKKASLNQAEKQIKTLRQSVKVMKKQISSLQSSLSESDKKINSLEQLGMQKTQLIEQLHHQRQKQVFEIKQIQSKYQSKQRQLNKKIESQRDQITQKSKEIVQLQNQRKNRIQILNSTVDSQRKQILEMQNMLHAEKNSNLKLNSILIDLTSNLTKIQKVHNIKSLYMMPIRDLMGKFQAVVKSSAKLHTQFEKKAVKNQQKIINSLSGEARLKRVNSNFK